MKRPLYLLVLSVVIVVGMAPAAQAQSGNLDCSAFANQETAQAILDAHGDLYGFDLDGDGIACEDLGDGTAEDGTLAPFGQYAQSGYAGTAPAQLAETGGLSLLILAGVAMLLVGTRLITTTLAVGQRGFRVGDFAGSRNTPMNVSANGKRLVLIVLAAALAILVAIVLGTGVVGPTKSASAQGANPLYLTTSAHPSPTDRILRGTRMDLLITEQNVTAGGRSARNVRVTDVLPDGVRYVAASSSQGQCALVGTSPSTITCIFNTIPPGGVAHINIVVEAVRRGTFTSHVYDNRGNEASARFTIVR